MSESAVMLLPQPDSPTIASVSPGASAKLIPSTALTTPWRVVKKVCSASTSSKGRGAAASAFWVAACRSLS